MPENLRTVSIGELIVSSAPDDVLVAYGLGSCVAVCLYDSVAGVAGMLHALLPTVPDGSRVNGNTSKFVDHGVPLLLTRMAQAGARKERFTVRLVGGARMLNAPGFSDSMNIGARNVAAAEAALAAAGLRIKAQDTGGQAGRTVRLHVRSGQLLVKTLGQKELALA